MIRVALIAGTYQPQHCGVADYTARLRSTLAERGVDSIVLTTFAAAKTVNAPDVQGVVENWQLSSLLPLVWAVHQTGADLLHIQHAAGTYGFERAIFLLPLLLRLTGWTRPIATTVHEYGWWELQPEFFPSELLELLKIWGQEQGWWDREDGFLLTGSNAIITTNQQAAQVMCDRLPALKSRLHQIPIAANVQVFEMERFSSGEAKRSQAQQVLRQTLGWGEDTEVITFFGFLHPVKGLETLLAAFKAVQTSHPQARLLLLGGVESLALPGEQAENYWQKLEQLIAELELQSLVQMTGYLLPEKASHYLAGSTIAALPFNHGVTLKSGSLLTLLAHGLPLVITRSDPPEAELIDRQLVLQVAPKNKEQLAKALIELLDNQELRDRLGKAGQQFSQKFSWDSITNAHLQIYQSLLHSS